MPAVETNVTTLRARPSQGRSVATFNLILDTTGSLLEKRGFSAVTTNLIAVEAGVTVRAIYRYFPNKHAIVAELARRMEAQWQDELAPLDGSALPWRELWCRYIDTFVAAVRATPGGRSVLLAMRGDPELRRIDDEANEAYTAGIADALRAREPSLALPRARALATVLMRSTVAVLDEAFDADAKTAAQLVELMKAMHVALLERYLGEPHQPRADVAKTRAGKVRPKQARPKQPRKPKR